MENRMKKGIKADFITGNVNGDSETGYENIIDMLERIFQPNKDIVARRILDEMILVPIRGKHADMQRVLALNELGEFIWEQMDDQQNLATVR